MDNSYGSEEENSCNYDVAIPVDSMSDIDTLNLKEMSCEEIMRYHFLDRILAFMFYNWYACLHGFVNRKSRVVSNINS